jgi:hypothetical protein
MIGIRPRAAIKRDEVGRMRKQNEAEHGKSANHCERRLPDASRHGAIGIENPRQP